MAGAAFGDAGVGVGESVLGAISGRWGPFRGVHRGVLRSGVLRELSVADLGCGAQWGVRIPVEARSVWRILIGASLRTSSSTPSTCSSAPIPNGNGA